MWQRVEWWQRMDMLELFPRVLYSRINRLNRAMEMGKIRFACREILWESQDIF